MLWPLTQALFDEPSPGPVKAALAQRLNLPGDLRAPMTQASEAGVQRVREALLAIQKRWARAVASRAWRTSEVTNESSRALPSVSSRTARPRAPRLRSCGHRIDHGSEPTMFLAILMTIAMVCLSFCLQSGLSA